MTTQDHNSSSETPLTDAQFDAYLQRKSQLSQQYLDLGSGAMPPPTLDRAVLSQAHAAVGAAKRSRLLRWSGPLALAASVVVVVSLVLEPAMQREISQSAAPASAPQSARFPEFAERTAREPAPLEMRMLEPADVAAPPEADDGFAESIQQAQPAAGSTPQTEAFRALATDADRKAMTKAEQTRADTAKAVQREVVPPSSPPVSALPPTTAIRQTSSIAPLPPLPPMPAPVRDPAVNAEQHADSSGADLLDVTVTAKPRQNQPHAGAGPRGSVSLPRAQQEAETPAAEELIEQTNPSAWLERIRELRRAGRARAADREWQRFMKQYPDYTVDANDLARPTSSESRDLSPSAQSP